MIPNEMPYRLADWQTRASHSNCGSLGLLVEGSILVVHDYDYYDTRLGILSRSHRRESKADDRDLDDKATDR